MTTNAEDRLRVMNSLGKDLLWEAIGEGVQKPEYDGLWLTLLKVEHSQKFLERVYGQQMPDDPQLKAALAEDFLALFRQWVTGVGIAQKMLDPEWEEEQT